MTNIIDIVVIIILTIIVIIIIIIFNQLSMVLVGGLQLALSTLGLIGNTLSIVLLSR